jgi:phosphatidylserine/phosphatidylglycerophosphate/cardiolipin synthase-like enzyme
MTSGKRLKSFRVKAFLFAVLLGLIFVYSNVTGQETSHNARVTILPDRAFLPEFIRDIAHAKKSIYIAIYMFKSYSDETQGAGLIKRSLIRAAGRGVNVFIVMDSSDDDSFVDKENKKIGSELEKHGIRVAYDTPETRMHSKCAVIDGDITYIGSHNYTNSALKHNHEVTVRIVSKDAAVDALRHIRSIR